jgi:hypothetical protein
VLATIVTVLAQEIYRAKYMKFIKDFVVGTVCFVPYV